MIVFFEHFHFQNSFFPWLHSSFFAFLLPSIAKKLIKHCCCSCCECAMYLQGCWELNAPFTRVFRSTKTTLRQSVESIVFNHLAHLYSLVTAVVQELLSKTWKRTLDFIVVYNRYDWLLLGNNQNKVNQFLQLKCSLSHKIQT